MFTAVGRGRRPSLPKVDAKVVANLTWLQLFQLKLELEASWTAVTKWARLLFPGLPTRNPRRIMERVAVGLQKTTHKDVFITLTTDMDVIGPFCTQLGICRYVDSDGLSMPSVRYELCYGAVIELVNVYDRAHNILHCLFPETSVQDWKALGHKVAMQAKRLRCNNITTKLGVYLVEKVGVASVEKDVECEKVVESKKGVEAEKENEGEKEVLAETKFKNVQVEKHLLCKENQALRKELQKLKEETERLNLKLECSEEVIVENDDVLEKLGVL